MGSSIIYTVLFVVTYISFNIFIKFNTYSMLLFNRYKIRFVLECTNTDIV